MDFLHRGYFEGALGVDSQQELAGLLEGTVGHNLRSMGFLDTVLGDLLAPCILDHR